MRSVGMALYLREVKTRLGGQWWGLVWTLAEPLANAAMLFFIYAQLRARAVGGVDTLLFLVTGLLPFQLFKSLVLRGMEAIEANQGLFAYRQVRPVDAVLARAGVELTLGTVMLGVTALVLAWMGHDIWPRQPLELLACSALLVAFGTALGLFAAVVTAGPLARGRAVVRLAFLPIYLSSGAIFPIASLPQGVRDAFLFNPLVHLLDALRAGVFGPDYRVAPGSSVAVPLACTLVIGVLAMGLYRMRRDQLLNN